MNGPISRQVDDLELKRRGETLSRPWQWLRHEPEPFKTSGFHLLIHQDFV